MHVTKIWIQPDLQTAQWFIGPAQGRLGPFVLQNDVLRDICAEERLAGALLKIEQLQMQVEEMNIFLSLLLSQN